MWNLVIIAYIITVVYAQQQNSRRPEQHDNGHGWDIRLAVPGEPGGDYPTLNTIPRTSFSCSRKSPGYYADVETGCQVFRVCTLGSTYGFQSFVCPNGTLFNQKVFVCDWWMNVNCDRSQQLLFNDNAEKFGNLKLGPQLMKDVKKMLTHPMRNPYDKSMMKSNLIVMQEYKPPLGQLFPNGALISGPERPPSNIYIPAKQRQGNFAQNSFISGDLSFAASTPSPQYISPSFNSFGSSKDIDIIQQKVPIQNSNSYTATTHAKDSESINNNRISQYQNQNHNLRDFQSTPQNIPKGQPQRHLQQYNINNKQPDKNVNKNPTQQFTYPSKQSGQLIQNNNIAQFSKEGVGREAIQNFGNSNGVQPTGKTFKFSRIVQKSTSGNPKSRITFKTWIIRPTKTARLVADHTPYTYYKPTSPREENSLVDTTVYDKNLTTGKLNPETENVPYVYNRPTPSSKQIIAVEETPFIYLPPTMPTLSNRLYSTSNKLQTFKQTHLDLPPTTYKPASRFYVPPSEGSSELSRQYLSPDMPSLEANNYQNARLVVSPTSLPLDFTTAVSKNIKNPSFSLIKQSDVNTNRNNLTFANILTKEKLDITVNDIVKNTNEILKTGTPGELNQYRQNHEIADKVENNHLTREFGNEIDENLTLHPTHTLHKNEQVIATPSTELEPPIIMPNNNYQYSNRLLNLPFFKEPAVPTNTIERTVSLKITIPETIAELLFKNVSKSNSDNLEILNTGSSNYLVLTNNHLDENNEADLIPIGKIIWEKNINVSNTQELVYSLLADSLNAVKEYFNIAKQNYVPLSAPQLQTNNINNEDIGEITDKVSRLTSSQFSNDNANSGNIILPPTSNEWYNGNSKHMTESSQRYALNRQPNFQRLEQNPPNPLYSSRLQRLSSNNHNIENLPKNTEQIYSGQLYQVPVPEVTSKIYNSPNLIQGPQVRRTNELSRNLQPYLKDNENIIKKQPKTDVEVLPSKSYLFPPVRQELLPRSEVSPIRFHNIQNSNENVFVNNFLNTDSAITAQVQDKITGSLPHPLEENKLITYQKNKSYYLYSKLDDDNNDNMITQTTEPGNVQNAKLTSSNNLANHVAFKLFPANGYELSDEREKRRNIDTFNSNDFSNHANNDRNENFNQRQDLVTGVDFTILHPSSRKHVQQDNNVNTILYRGPSSYLAPQSSVGSLGDTQQTKTNARIEQFDNNGYSKTIPARQFSF